MNEGGDSQQHHLGDQLKASVSFNAAKPVFPLIDTLLLLQGCRIKVGRQADVFFC